MTGNVTGFTYTFFSKNKKFQNTAAVKAYYLYSQVFRTDDKKTDDGSSIKKEPDQTTNKDLFWGYNEGVSYEFLRGIRVKASFEHTLRLPDPEELFGDGISVKSSVNLKPEKRQFQFGFDFRQNELLGINSYAG